MKTLMTIFSMLLLLMFSNAAQAQFLRKLERKVVNTAERAIERKAEQKTEAVVNKVWDKGTDTNNYTSSKAPKDKKNKKAKNDSNTEAVLLKEE